MNIIQKITKIRLLNLFFGNIYLALRLFYQEMKFAEFRRKYHIHPTFCFNGPGTIFYGDGEIYAGSNSHIGRHSAISTSKGNKVVIGKGCALSHYVMMYTSSSEPNQDFSKMPLKKVQGDIIIGDYCWIGARVFIKHGVVIGKNCVIGANSVVTKDIPDYSIAVGCPARVIKKIEF